MLYRNDSVLNGYIRKRIKFKELIRCKCEILVEYALNERFKVS